MVGAMKLWTWRKEELPSLPHALRTAVAATAVGRDRAAGGNARGLLGCDCHFGVDAINAGCDADALD